MKPIAADTESVKPNRYREMSPPIAASGTLTRISAVIFSELKALKSSMKISKIDSGTTTASRAMARSWFSNSPDQVSV